MRRWFLRAALLIGPCLMTGFDCSSSGGPSSPGGPLLPADTSWTHPTGKLTVDVRANPFAIVVKNRSGDVLLESASLHDASNAADPLGAYAPVAMTHNEDLTLPYVMEGWDYYHGQDDPFHHGTQVVAYDASADALVVHVASDEAAHQLLTVRFAAEGNGLRLTALVDGATAVDPEAVVNRLSLAFKMHDDDHFLGFGERFVYTDHRGQLLYTWVEDGGFGQGEGTPVGPSNPFPHGPGQTNMPIPWLMSPRGFGMLLNTSWRSVYHLGDETTDAWRVEAWNAPSAGTPAFDATIFADPDPLVLVEELTAITGRPPEVADYVLAPRRRIDPGTVESQKLRAAHIPTSVADLDVHYFPNGGGADGAAMKALNTDFHARGFKTVAYFCPFVADSWHPVFDDAVAKGYLVKHADGTPYLVLDTPYNAGMVDFTNPGAVKWYQGFLQQALDDGWDGWMYDFAEYVPLDAVMFDGTSGAEAHNAYPLLYQKAAFDLLQDKRRGDYLTFVRSGYAGPAKAWDGARGANPTGTLGTGGLVPMVWAGDQSTDFDITDGLPAALTGALNVGMSGVPLWGSDISGYHYVYNPPPDKEVYLRWTELGAFSADMHDENAGAGNAPSSDRWQIWKDQESQDVYRKYASYKTRMLPYVRVAVRQARERGTPVMRHLYLSYPRDPNVYGIGDEYMYGDSLLVAPVVARGQTSRAVYLPEPSYFDFWTGARVLRSSAAAGDGKITAVAPLDVVPVLAKLGAIVPMLASDVETVATPTDGSVVSAADRADFLEVAVFAGGQSSVTLDDGTVLSQSAPSDPFAPGAPSHTAGAIPMAASLAELMTCDACAWDDPASHVFSVAVRTQADSIDAGPLKLGVNASPTVRRFLFTVRH